MTTVHDAAHLVIYPLKKQRRPDDSELKSNEYNVHLIQ